MVYDIVVYATGTGGTITPEIEIHELPDNAPPPINNGYIKTFRFYDRWKAEECARNFGRY